MGVEVDRQPATFMESDGGKYRATSIKSKVRQARGRFPHPWRNVHPCAIPLGSSLALISLALIGSLDPDFRAPVRPAFNPSPLHRLVVIPAFVADFRTGTHDNDFPFGRAVVAPHPDLGEFFVEHDKLFQRLLRAPIHDSIDRIGMRIGRWRA